MIRNLHAAAAALLAFFGLDQVERFKWHRERMSERRGRFYGHGSRKYSGPRVPGRRRPAMTPAKVKAWRKARP